MKRCLVENASKDVIGFWVAADRQIRLQLMSDPRFDEARGSKEHVYYGSYQTEGHTIHSNDQNGYGITGEFRDGVLHADKYKFHRE